MNDVEIRDALDEDVVRVVYDLCEVSKDETDALGLTVDDLFARASACREDGELDAILQDGEAVALVGHLPTDPHRHSTWFVARTEFMAPTGRSVFVGRRYMRALARRWPKISFMSATSSEHYNCRRWFELMGFKLQHEAGTVSLYEFKG